MNDEDTDLENGTPTLPDGTPIKLGCKQPNVLKFSAVPSWDSANPVLSEGECLDTDRNLQFITRPTKYQHYSNCTNASLAGLCEALKRQSGEQTVEPLSMSMQYALHNGGQDEGAMCRDLADDLRKRGLCRESLWQESKIYLPASGLPQSVLDDAKQTVALEVYQCLSWEDVRSALARDFFVYHGFVLGNSFFKTGVDGKVPTYDGRLANGHAMFSCGLTRKFGPLRTVTPNSWGDTFGNKGIGYIDKSYFWSQSGSFVNLDAYAVRSLKTHETSTVK